MTRRIWHSVLGSAIAQFLALRQSLGYRDQALAARLVVFDRYLVAQGQTDPWLTREVVDAWVTNDPRLKPVSRARRYSAVRLLGRFLADQSPQTYIPGLGSSRPSAPTFTRRPRSRRCSGKPPA